MSVSVKNLSKIYGKQKAVDNLSFEIQSGEIVGFLGPNGAGKSTTMKIMTCYLPPTKGSIEVVGLDVRKDSIEIRKNIGYLPQDNPLYLDMYVREYLGFIGRLHKIKGKKLKKRIEEVVEMCGLTRERKKKIGTLSGGYKQRVGLAQALIHDPPVLILDEPTIGLDPNQVVEIRHLIKEMGKEKTVIFSTHIMQEVEEICNRAIIINLGQVVADSSISDLQNLQAQENNIVIEFEKAIDTQVFMNFEGIKEIEKIGESQYKIYVSNQEDMRAKIAKLASEKEWLILGMKQEESSLESIFQKLTK